MGIEFDTDQNEFHIKSRKLLGDLETPTMVKMLLNWGVVKTEKQALVVLVLVVVLVFGVTWFVLGMRNNPANATVTAPDGTKYTAEEYFDLVRQGKDPLR